MGSALLTFGVLRVRLRDDQSGPGVNDDPNRLQHLLWRIFISNGISVVYFLYAVVMCLAFLVLCLYHLVIMGYNLTTNEHVRDYYVSRNPFDGGWTTNYRQVLCAPYGWPAGTDRHAKEATHQSQMNPV